MKHSAEITEDLPEPLLLALLRREILKAAARTLAGRRNDKMLIEPFQNECRRWVIPRLVTNFVCGRDMNSGDVTEQQQVFLFGEGRVFRDRFPISTGRCHGRPEHRSTA